MTFTTDAIVLSYTLYREHDRFYTVYTRDYGKLVLLARGANKIKSKLAGHLEPSSHASLMIARGRACLILAQARAITSFARLRLSADLLLFALSVLKAVDVLTHLEESDQYIFYLIWHTLARFQGAGTGEEREALWYWYLLHLLIRLGYAPNVADERALQMLLVADIPKGAILGMDAARRLVREYARLALPDQRLSSFFEMYERF